MVRGLRRDCDDPTRRSLPTLKPTGYTEIGSVVDGKAFLFVFLFLPFHLAAPFFKRKMSVKMLLMWSTSYLSKKVLHLVNGYFLLFIGEITGSVVLIPEGTESYIVF